MDGIIQDTTGHVICRYIGDPSDQASYKCLDHLSIPAANFASCNLENFLLDNTFLAGADLADADMYGTMLSFCNFSQCNLRNAIMRGTYTYRTIFWKADIRGADFSRDNLGGVTKLQQCDFSEITWDSKTNFEGALYDENTIFPNDFCPNEFGMEKMHENNSSEDDSSSNYIIIRHKDLRNHVFSGDLDDSIINDCNLENCLLKNMSFYYADFSLCNLRNVDFSNTNLERAIFRYADLRGAKFLSTNSDNPTNLSGADLRTMIYDNTTLFNGALYSNYTRFPQGFCPVQHNMKKNLDPFFMSKWQYTED